MKVYISADMEGVTGVCHWDEVTHTHQDYPRFQRQLTREVVAACQGALAAGATEVVVKDAHATARNLDPADLPRGVRLIRGWSGHPLCMVQELDATFMAAAFVGWHARAGGAGNPLAHTMSSSRIAEMRLNGRPASEYLLHAHAAELHEVPVVLVSGDAELGAEVGEVSPRCAFVASQEGRGLSVVARHPEQVVEELRAGVEAALRAEPAACRLPRSESYRLEVRYKRPSDAYGRAFYPGAERIAPDAVALQSPEYFEVLRALRFLL